METLATTLVQIFAACTLYLLIIVICTALEFISPREPFDWRSRAKGVYIELAGRVVRFFLIAPIIAIMVVSNPVKIIDLSSLPDWFNIFLLVVLGDFIGYWLHRFEHRFLWAIHVVHHSPRQLHAANTWGHPLQYIMIRVFKYFPLVFIDFGGAAIPLAAVLIIQVHTYWIHSQTRVHFGPLRRFFIDNRFHRIHHGIAPEFHDKNFGVVFPFWDRMFGTAVEPLDDENPEVGVEGVEPPNGVLSFLAMPFVQWHKALRKRLPLISLKPNSGR